MDSLNAEAMSETKLAELLPLWKSFAQLCPVLQSEAKGAEIILRWISNSVEFKLKKEALISSKTKLTELQTRVKERLRVVIDKNVQLGERQERVHELGRQIAQAQAESQQMHAMVSAAGFTQQQQKQTEPFTKEEIFSGEGTTKDPVISFNFAKKPAPRREQNVVSLGEEEKSGPRRALPPAGAAKGRQQCDKDEFMDEQGNSIKVEAGEGPLQYCKTKLNKYFC